MTGLLHRLAARAAGTGWTVRSDVRLPFGAAGLEQAQDQAPPLVDAAAPESRAPGRLRPESAVSAAAVPRQAVAPRAQIPVVAAEPGRPQPAAAAAMPQPQLPQAHQSPSPLMPAATAPPRHAPDASAVAGKASGIPSLALLHTPARTQSPPPRSHHEDPAPLLPTRPSTGGHAAPLAQTVRSPAAFALRPAPQSVANQETEVHIHIGRIDVTALHEAPRPKARPRERTQPVSLDAYLAARSKP